MGAVRRAEVPTLKGAIAKALVIILLALFFASSIGIIIASYFGL